MICSKMITREQALLEMENPPYPENMLEKDLKFVIKKFELTPEEFEKILISPKKDAKEYPGHYFLLRYKNIFRKIATSA